MFLDDKKLQFYWNNPLKKIALFNICAAIATPDFSIYPTINDNEIRHNIYHKQHISVDLLHEHGGVQPHIHIDLQHNKKDPGIPPTPEQEKLIKKIKKEFNLL
jgi:hypothetical protein